MKQRIRKIFHSSYYQERSGVPTWHIPRNRPSYSSLNNGKATAMEVLEELGDVKITLHEMSMNYQGKKLNSGLYGIMRHAIPNPDFGKKWQKHHLLGVVSNRYEHITPQQTCETWDKYVKLPIDNMSFFNAGASLFIAGKLPSIDIKGGDGNGGETIDQYMIFINPSDGGGAVQSYITGLRPFCTNIMGRVVKEAVARFRVPHKVGAADRVGVWMQEQVEAATQTLELIKSSYEKMIDTPITEGQMKFLIHDLYPDPKKPDASKGYKNFEQKVKDYERKIEQVATTRDLVERFATGQGTGIGDTPLTQGLTGYTLYNAVTEYETYRAGTSEAMSKNVITGDRANTINRAAERILALQF